MLEVRDVTSRMGGECYLILGDEGAVMLDTGFEFCACEVVENIKRELGERTLDAILLTHSHYDHASGAPAIKEAYPEAVVCAHPRVGEIFAKPGARRQMRTLNDDAARRAGMFRGIDRIDRLAVDRDVTEGEILTFRDIRVTMFETPGHTRCSVSWYFPDDGLLCASESSGVAPAYPTIFPCFIINYGGAQESMRRSAAMGASRVLVPHSKVVPETVPGEFFRLASKAAAQVKDFVWSRHLEGKSQEEIFADLKKWLYVGINIDIQPEGAFDLNMGVMISRLIPELEAGEAAG